MGEKLKKREKGEKSECGSWISFYSMDDIKQERWVLEW